MTSGTVTLVEELDREGIQLWADGDQLGFRAPRGRVRDSHRGAVAAEKNAILEMLRARGEASRCPLPSAPDAEVIWAPTVQQRMVAMSEQIRPITIMHWWPGPHPLEIEVLQAALDRVVLRHGALRTRYAVDGEGRWWAVTARSPAAQINVVDLQGLSQKDREAEGRRITAAAILTPFDMLNGPLLRFTVCRIGPAQTLILGVIQHSVFDAWSTSVFNSELAAFYRGAISATPVELPQPAQVHELATAEVKWLQGAEAQPHIDYWRQKLSDARAPFWLPADRRTPCGEATPAPIRDRLDPQATAVLREFCRDQQSTVGTGFAAAVSIGMALWSRRSDVFLWNAYFGRPKPEHFGVIGFLASYWLQRVDLAGDPTLSEALRRVHEVHREALPHLRVPPPLLRPFLTRTPSEKLLPRTTLNYVSAPSAAARGTDEADLPQWMPNIDHVDMESRNAMFVFALEAEDLSWMITYERRLFEDSTIAWLSRCLKEILVSMASRPGARISELTAAGDIPAPGSPIP